MRLPFPCVPPAAIVALLAVPSLAASAFHGSGTMTVDESTVRLTVENSTLTPKPFSGAYEETLVRLSDRDLGDTSPDDEVEMDARARAGGLAVLTVRLDGTRLVNVAFTHHGLRGTVVLPGSWFRYRPAEAAPGTVAGTLELEKRRWNGHAYACAVEFVARGAPPSRTDTGTGPFADASTGPSNGAPNRIPAAEEVTKLLLQAMLQKDEQRAVRLVQLGADPNGRDQWGVPVLSRAAGLCLAPVVRALVAAGANVTGVRPGGVTLLQDASECPEAAKILRAAGAK